MAGVQTSEPAPELLVLAAPPPIDDYRYATAILDPDGRYLLVNPSFAGLHGVGPDDLRGRAETELIARSVATALAGNDRLALDAPTAVLTEERVVDSVGRRRVVMCRCALFDADHKPYAVVRMYGSASARDRVIAEFHQLLDAIDPTGTRTREFEAARLGTNAGTGATAETAANAGTGPSAGPGAGAGAQAAGTRGADRAQSAEARLLGDVPDDSAIRRAAAAAETERAAREAVEALLADERVARANAETQLRAERDGRAQTEAQLGTGRALAGRREQDALARVAELETALAELETTVAELETSLATEGAARSDVERAARAASDELRRMQAVAGADAGAIRRQTEAAIAAERDTRQLIEADLEAERGLRRQVEADLEAERGARRQVEADLQAERGARRQVEAELEADRRVREGVESAQSTERDARRRAQTELAAALDALQRAEAAARAEAETRRGAEAKIDSEAAEFASLEARWAAEYATVEAALAEAQAEARALAARHAALQTAHADTQVELQEARQAVDLERSTRESLAADLGSAGARSAATETLIRAQAAAVEARLASERKAREKAESRARDVAAQQAAERAAREQAEARASQLEAQRAAETKMRQQAESKAREEDGRRREEAKAAAERLAREEAETAARQRTDASARKAANARLQELEAQHAVARGARQQAETRAQELEARVRTLESEHAAERRARESAEARTLQLQADRLAARSALDALRRRLDPGAPDDLPGAPDDLLRAEDELPIGRGIPIAAAPLRAAPEPPTPQPARPTGPSRRRSPTIYRQVAASTDGTLPALSALLAGGRNPAAAKSLRAVLPAALSLIGESSGWDAVAMWQEAQSGRPLTCLGIWTRRGHELDWFESISWHAKLELGDSPSGDIDAAGRLTWVPDLGTEGEADLSARERTARAAGLASRVVVPLSSAKRIVGGLELLGRDVRQPDEVAIARLASGASALTPLLLRDTRDAEQRRWRV